MAEINGKFYGGALVTDEPNNNKMRNLGIILGSRSDDYVGGTLPHEVRNESGNWSSYLPTGEIQRGNEDWMDCTIRSDTNTIEIQEKFLTGIESDYNDREAAIGAKVMRQGAYLWQGAEYIRKTGLAQQSTWPDSGGTFDEQYANPSPEIRAKLDAEKAEWLTKWDIKHEDISVSKASLKYHLKHAPLQVVIPGHAVVDIFSENGVDRIFDSYPPYTKNVPGYGGIYEGPISFAKKIVLYKREQAVPDEHLLVDIKYLDSGRQVIKLHRALRKIGWVDGPPESEIYDDKLADYILRFIKANLWEGLGKTGWVYYWHVFYYKGRLVDESVRRVINRLLKS